MEKWAQLIGGLSSQTPELQRGHWYRVIDHRIDPGGLVRVMGPGAIGYTRHEDFFRIIDREPDKITRVTRGTAYRPDTPGELPSGISAYGICPKDHTIDPLPGDPQVKCTECDKVYEIEDEQHG